MNNINQQDSWQSSLKQTTVKLGVWTAAWLVSTALLAFGPNLLWDFSALPTSLAAIVNLGVGAMMIRANIQQVQAMDELGRKIFLDAAAITLGVGLVVACCYGLLQNVQLITFKPEISHLVLLMGVTFLVSVVLGNRRYQ